VTHRGAQRDPEVIDLALGLVESGELQLHTDGLRLLEQAPAPVATSGLAVLLVEDDDTEAAMISEALEHALEGAVLARVRTVAGAAALVDNSEWSLAIVDHELPDGLGVDVLDALRATHPTLPIVMLTEQGGEETAVDAFRRGASDYVVKADGYADALAARVSGLLADDTAHDPDKPSQLLRRRHAPRVEVNP
jgi:DNA-binding response OmpR family regulator